MDETRIQIGDEVLLSLDINADWYISSMGYDRESVDITLRKKSDRENSWAYTDPQTEIPEYAEWKEPFEKMTDCPWK